MFVPLSVQVVGRTQYVPPTGVPWESEDLDGQALAEFAGRSCFQSWSRPNPATATNAGYLAHILDVGHLSILEHASVSLYIEGVSRSLTHELIRHRHLQYSQLSQRYVADSGAMVMPPEFAGYGDAVAMLTDAASTAEEYYGRLVKHVENKLASQPMTKTARRKRARQAARAVLPNMTETKLVVTGNYRAWREVIALRATEHADTEIRNLAIAILRVLKDEAPNVFGDFKIITLDDGTSAAEVRS